jgi:hypothetical protein
MIQYYYIIYHTNTVPPISYHLLYDIVYHIKLLYHIYFMIYGISYNTIIPSHHDILY